ncbi:hypothetical protein LY78DRAFT_588434, partial [Colletotrichum sublineola]
AFIVGDYLYMDGGYLNRTIAGNDTYYYYDTVKNTLSLDLSKSWTPRDVQMRQIPKNAPTKPRQAYFVDASSGTVYGWGGLNTDPAPQQTLVGKFVADGNGGGSWSTEFESESDHKGLAALPRSHGGAVASTPDAGFYFGGISEYTTNQRWNDWISGYFQFDFKSRQKTWTNYTDSPYSPSRTRYAATAHYVPTLGPNGMIMIMGGNELDAGSGGDSALSMETLWFLDPVTHEWYSQKTIGRPPSRRRWSCTVGTHSPNGTYEIFLFGGFDNKMAFDDVYILSLPGFVWQRADVKANNGTARSFMGCVLAGQRQMIVVGGKVANKNAKGRDPFPQGLGIFDVTDLQWKDEYDAKAAEYDSPAIIKSWYITGNLANLSDPVRALFQSTPESDSRGHSGSTAEQSPLTSGAVAGIVIGGVLLVGLIGVAAFFLRRRRNCRTQSGGAPVVHKDPQYSPKELSTETEISELSIKQPNPELQGHDPRYYAAELDASQTLQDPRKYPAGLDLSPISFGSQNQSPITPSTTR